LSKKLGGREKQPQFSPLGMRTKATVQEVSVFLFGKGHLFGDPRNEARSSYKEQGD
jgi:hypothetical protein